MGPFDLFQMGAAGPGIGSPLIKALLAKHGASLPDLAPDVGPPKVGAEVGPQMGADDRASNVFDSLSSFADKPDPSTSVLGDGAMDGIKSSLAANATKPRGFLDRIGDFLHSDEGRAEAMRFAAGAFKGGMGGGLDAATNFADRRHHEAAETASADADRAEHGREFDENHAFHLGQLDDQREQNENTRRHYERGDYNDSRRIDADLYKHDTPSGDERTRSQTSIYTHLNPSGDTIANTNERRFEHVNPSGDTAMTQTNENLRAAANNQTAITTANINHQPPKDSIHVHYQTTPDRFRSDHASHVAAVRPSEVQPGDAGSMVHHIANDDQYNALPSGTRFQGPDGQVRIKP